MHATVQRYPSPMHAQCTPLRKGRACFKGVIPVADLVRCEFAGNGVDASCWRKRGDSIARGLQLLADCLAVVVGQGVAASLFTKRCAQLRIVA